MYVFVFVFVQVQVQVDPDKPRDLVVLNLDWSTRVWELREYFEVGVRFFVVKYRSRSFYPIQNLDIFHTI